MRRRKRSYTLPRGGLTHERMLRFEVVRGVLMGHLSLHDGAATLGMDIDDLAALCAGARQAIIRALGEQALEQFEQRAAA